MKLSIVIPVFNEEKTICSVVERALSALLPDGMEREIIIVNDASTDNTRSLLEKLSSDPVVIQHHSINRGKGAALRTGYKACTGDIVVVQDADMEYDPNEYGILLGPILRGNADVVYGSRFMGGQAHRVVYFWHSVGNKLLTLLSNIFTDLNLTDMETCYKMFKKDVLDKLHLEEDRFGIEPEVTAKLANIAKTENLSIYEVGISYYGRTYEEGKKIGFRDALRAAWCIWKYNTSTAAKIVKYATHGVLVAASQLIAIFLLIESLGFSNEIQQNIAHAISIEVSILVGFVLHSLITWRYQFTGWLNVLDELLKFHLVTGISFTIRVGMFFLLQQAGVGYLFNTIIGIGIAVLINYLGYDNLVFKKKACRSKRQYRKP